MPHYVALIHKDPASCYGVQFPDVPGVVTAGDTLDEAMTNAADALAFAAEDWQDLTGRPFPEPRTLDELRNDPDYREAATNAVVAVVPFTIRADEIA